MRLKLVNLSGILFIFIFIIASGLFAQHKDFTEGIMVTMPIYSGRINPSFSIVNREDVLLFKNKISKLEEIAKPSQSGDASSIVFPPFLFETRGFPELPNYGTIYHDNVVELIFIKNNNQIIRYYKDRNYELEIWFASEAKKHIKELEEHRKFVEWRINQYENNMQYNDNANRPDGNTSDNQGSDSSHQPNGKEKKKLEDLTEEPGDRNSNGAIKEAGPKQTAGESGTGPEFYWYILFAVAFLVIALITFIVRRRNTNEG